MKRLTPFFLAVLLVGCDTSGIEVKSGQFRASLTGALTGSIEGEAAFALSNCATFRFLSEAGHLDMGDDCVTSRDQRGQTGPVEGTFAFGADYQDGYSATWQIGTDGPYYRAVGGEIEIVDRDRTRTRGRFSIEAKPLGSPIGPNVRVIEDGESLFLEGEFDAEGFNLIY